MLLARLGLFFIYLFTYLFDVKFDVILWTHDWDEATSRDRECLSNLIMCLQYAIATQEQLPPSYEKTCVHLMPYHAASRVASQRLITNVNTEE